MRNYSLLVVLLVAICGKVSGQLTYFSDAEGKLYTVDLSNGDCKTTLLGQMIFNGVRFVASDLAFHPNGMLYATDGRDLFEINVTNRAVRKIGSHNVQGILTALVCDQEGTMYAASENLYTVNIGTGRATNLGRLTCVSAGDLAFENGDLYLACESNQLLKVNITNPSASEIIGRMNSPIPFFGIVSFATDCENLRTFGTAGNRIYEIDVSNANAVLFCTLPSEISHVFGATTEDDFIASECEITLDLDEDDDSGAEGIDFFADSICGGQLAQIADTSDALIDVKGLTVDSMVVRIVSGAVDGNAEQLLLTQAEALDIVGSGSDHLRLTNTLANADVDLLTPLKAIRYVNTASAYTVGTRKVSVQIFAEGSTQSDTAMAFITLIEPPSMTIELGGDTSLCLGQTFILDASHPDAVQYEWSTGDSGPQIEVVASGTYAVTVTNSCGGQATDARRVDFLMPEDILDLGADTLLCPEEVLTLDATLSDGVSYEWNTGAREPTIIVSAEGTYHVKVTTGCGIQSDAIFVRYQTIPTTPILPEDTLMCNGETLVLDASMLDAISYTWQDGSSEAQLTVSEAGEYAVTITLQCGTYQDKILVEYNDYDLTLDLGRDTTFCVEDVVELDVFSPYATGYLWQDGSTEATFVVDETGSYSVTITDGCTSISDQINLIKISCCKVFVPNAFTPNFDGVNDSFQTFSDCSFSDFEMHIFDRWGGRVFQTNDQQGSWDGRANGIIADVGVYLWKVEYYDGVENQVISGDVKLVR